MNSTHWWPTKLNRLGLKADAIIPRDEAVYRYDLEQKPLMENAG